jgi:Protein of unknwon function (DUF3008)
MPATSKAQRRMMAIAEHHPEQLYAENKGAADMSKKQLHDFAATSEKGKPEHKSKHDSGRGATSKHTAYGRKPSGRGKY